MSGQLLMIAIGPVQDFIAQARRTRDLWHGSHLLSELSRYTARMLAEGGAELIFPALEAGHVELEYTADPWRNEDRTQPALNIANVILAHVKGDAATAETLARTARDELFRFWHDEVAGAVQKKVSAKNGDPGLLQKGTEDVWDEQIDSLLEFVAAWDAVGDGPGSYKAARDRLARAIAGRKNLRDFEQWHVPRPGAPKSSLDGARVSMLAKDRASKLFRTYRIEGQEQLDAVGLVKRCGGKPEQFVPLTNIALASWLKAAAEDPKAARELGSLRKACRETAGLEGLGYVWRNLPGLDPFRHDAALLLQSRWKPLLEKELGFSDWRVWTKDHLRRLLAAMSEPFPYVACLVADGDFMGKTIDALADDAAGMERHRAFSKKLSEFANVARDIVEQDHMGSLVYSGGDDVLAFLSLPEALGCAEDLRRGFEKLMEDAVPAGAVPADTKPPSLSVGIGIGHVQESMGELLELGRRAEKLAKGGDIENEEARRNALAIILDKRSGGVRKWRAQWPDDPAKTLSADVKALRDSLSTRKVYQIAETLARLPAPGRVGAGENWSLVLVSEVMRLLKRAGEGELAPVDVGLALDVGEPYDVLYHRLSAWIDRVLIARFIVGSLPSAKAGVAKEVPA